MKSTASTDSERAQNSKKIIEEARKWKNRLPKNRIKEIIKCSFCCKLAVFLAIRKDGKVIPCCERCISFIDEDTPWLMTIRRV